MAGTVPLKCTKGENFDNLPCFVMNSYVEMIPIPTYPYTHETPRGYGYLPTDIPTKEKPVSIPVTYAPTGFSSWVRNPG